MSRKTKSCNNSFGIYGNKILFTVVAFDAWNVFNSHRLKIYGLNSRMKQCRFKTVELRNYTVWLQEHNFKMNHFLFSFVSHWSSTLTHQEMKTLVNVPSAGHLFYSRSTMNSSKMEYYVRISSLVKTSKLHLCSLRDIPENIESIGRWKVEQCHSGQLP